MKTIYILLFMTIALNAQEDSEYFSQGPPNEMAFNVIIKALQDEKGDLTTITMAELRGIRFALGINPSNSLFLSVKESKIVSVEEIIEKAKKRQSYSLTTEITMKYFLNENILVWILKTPTLEYNHRERLTTFKELVYNAHTGALIKEGLIQYYAIE